MKDLQAKHKEWSDRNFSDTEPKTSYRDLDRMVTVAVLVGRMAHHTLKAYQGIRDSCRVHEIKFVQNGSDLLRLIEKSPASFGAPSHFKNLDSQALVGVIEEVGELAGATSHEERFDAVGDIALYLIDYCNHVGIDFEDAVRQTAAKVHARDWNKNSVNGEVAE